METRTCGIHTSARQSFLLNIQSRSPDGHQQMNWNPLHTLLNIHRACPIWTNCFHVSYLQTPSKESRGVPSQQGISLHWNWKRKSQEDFFEQIPWTRLKERLRLKDESFPGGGGSWCLEYSSGIWILPLHLLQRQQIVARTTLNTGFIRKWCVAGKKYCANKRRTNIDCETLLAQQIECNKANWV